MAKAITSVILIAFLASLSGAAGSASAAQTAGGGLLIPGVPRIDNIICISGCTKIRASSPGGTVQLSGTGMTRVKSVSFAGVKGKGKVQTEPTGKSATTLLVEVPKGAVTGPVRVLSSTGSYSSPSAQTLEIGPPPPRQASPLRISDAQTSPKVAYQYGARLPQLDFILGGGQAKNDIRIDVVSAKGSVVASQPRLNVPRGSSQRFIWNGRADGSPAPSGRYRFVVRALDGTKAALSSQQGSANTRAKRASFSFAIYGYVFPVRAGHTYGDGIGAGRGHQGLDVMARCGTPLIAARGGTVYYNSYQASGAGNYVVINLAGTRNESHAYMHLAQRSPFKVGSKVKTGQKIGVVGTTGRSTACHLHFEHWSSPGWYQGGTFLDPTVPVKSWDRYS
ncbi:MAG: M23 family metallopeptidase [Solirubrobacterales bacterium]